MQTMVQNTTATTQKRDTKPQANKPQTTKVGGAKAEKSDDGDEDAPKKERVAYAGERNADGRLTKAPTDFDRKEHNPLKRPDFVSDDLYMTWKAGELEKHGNEMLERAKKLRTQAEQIQKYGDPAQRAQVKKAQKLVAAFAEMRAQLAKEGINIEDILAAGAPKA